MSLIDNNTKIFFAADGAAGGSAGGENPPPPVPLDEAIDNLGNLSPEQWEELTEEDGDSKGGDGTATNRRS